MILMIWKRCIRTTPEFDFSKWESWMLQPLRLVNKLKAMLPRDAISSLSCNLRKSSESCRNVLQSVACWHLAMTWSSTSAKAYYLYALHLMSIFPVANSTPERDPVANPAPERDPVANSAPERDPGFLQLMGMPPKDALASLVEGIHFASFSTWYIMNQITNTGAIGFD